jgi:4-amino-4-deoxy-L-arabinose transferase-like glycosyltransferase
MRFGDVAFYNAASVGILLRLFFILAANPNDLTFHSGGSDAPSYVLLAQNLLHHLGLAYDGFPTAVRPPGYSLLLAARMQLFGTHYILAIRILQFALGLATIAICANVAQRLATPSAGPPLANSAANSGSLLAAHTEGRSAYRAALLIGLFLPTLIFTTAQLLTECIAAFRTAIFLQNLVRQRQLADTRSAWLMGASAGLESMFRFNAAALAIFAAAAIFASAKRARPPSRALRLALALLLPLLIVSPWLLRNERAFHGQVLYSTQSGPNAVQGVLTCSGRTQPGDSDLLCQNLGWELHQIETNEPTRADLPSEAVLDRAALAIVPKLWAAQGLHAIPLLARKLADFWLSADQLAWPERLTRKVYPKWPTRSDPTAGFPPRERALRATGVLSYWLVLASALLGYSRLRHSHPAIATLFLVYAATLTLLHLPLVMNTRLRIPLLDPLLVILASQFFSRRVSPS